MSDQPQQASSDRRLAAIMFTDIVGYTSLMQKDEDKALRTIERHRFILEKNTRKYNGRVLQYYGDGSLSIFPSAFEAVECALEIQKELTQDSKVPLRIGIHLGDVKLQGESVFGDGVNMASRIESLGVAGSILITDTIYYLVRNHSEVKTIPLGNFRLKNVDYPVPVYALTNDFLSVPKSEEMPGRIKTFPGKSTWIIAITILVTLILAAYGLFFLEGGRHERSDKSIAILPFENRSNDPQQEYFSDGITDDIISHLVKVSALKVKSRTSTEQYKNPDKTIPVIGRELGVSYILEGSVRKADNQVRIVAQLIDAKNDVHIWTETFDREITEIFQIQSEIAIEIAQVLEAKLSNEERRHIWGGPQGRGRPTDITAYDYVLRARSIWRNWNDENDLEDALRLVELAIRTDPSYARAYVLKGNILHYGMRNYGVPTQIWIDQALQMADQAISLDSTLAEAYLLRGNIFTIQDGKAELAQNNLEKAYGLAPGNPDILQRLGYHFFGQGKFEEGALMIIQSIERGFSLQDPEYHLRWGDLYLRMMDDYEKAEEFYQKAINLAPGWMAPYYHLGQLYRYWEKYDNAEEILSRALEIAPLDQESIDLMGWTNLLMGDLEGAARYWSMYEALERQFPDTSQYIPFRHRLGYVRYLQGDTVSAVNLMKEQLKRDLERQQELRGYGAWMSRGFYYDLAATNSFLGNREEALNWLDSAYHRGFVSLWYLKNDPLLKNIRKAPEFQRIQNELADRQQKRTRAFKKVIEENKGLFERESISLQLREPESKFKASFLYESHTIEISGAPPKVTKNQPSYII
jgi:adenylate cyclase